MCDDSRCFYCTKNQLTNTHLRRGKFSVLEKISACYCFHHHHHYSTLLSSLTYSLRLETLWKFFFTFLHLKSPHLTTTCLIAHLFNNERVEYALVLVNYAVFIE